MKWIAYSTYHMESNNMLYDSEDEAKADYFNELELLASRLAENELEDDWQNYYETEEEAYQATAEDIFKQLSSETAFAPIDSREAVEKLVADFGSDFFDESFYTKIVGLLGN